MTEQNTEGLNRAITDLFDYLEKYVGEDKEDKKIKDSVVALGVAFFWLVGDLVEENHADPFIDNIRKLTGVMRNKVNARAERTDSEAVEDHGNAGEGTEKGT